MKRLAGLDLFYRAVCLYFQVKGNFARLALLFVFLSGSAWQASAQSLKWTDSFESKKNPTREQCENWTAFLNSLAGRSFSSVTVYGSANPEGKTLDDGALATTLAGFLSAKTIGSVVASNGDIWAVGVCGPGGCGGGSVALTVTPGTSPSCGCTDQFSVRPHHFSSTVPGNWGGLAGTICQAPSQSMTVEFRLGAYITTPTTVLCPGGEIQLQANSNVCTGPYTFEWSNGQTGEFLTVSEPGDYYVTALGADGECSAQSDAITITQSDIDLIVGADQNKICEGQVQLTAAGTSSHSGSYKSKFCMYDALGGDCNFTNDICDDDSEVFGSTSIVHDITAKDPESISLNIYYALVSPATFVIRLNGEILGEPYQDNIQLSSCKPGAVGQYPRNFTFPLSSFEAWWNPEGPNSLEVEIQTADGGINLAGIQAEVTSKGAFYSWTPAETLTDASIFNPVATPTENTPYFVTYKDGNGCELTKSIDITVACPPVAVCKEAVTLYAGADCMAEVEVADINNDPSVDPEGPALEYSLSHQFLGLGTTNVTLTVTSDGGSATCVTPVTVVNTKPVINSVVAEPSSVDLGSPVTLTVDVADHNLSHATVDWGDLSEVETVENPAPVFDVSHTYASSGSYSVTVTAVALCGESAFAYETIVVSSASTGTASGGGWFESPRGAYFKNPRASGKATFAFDVSNVNSSSQPEGHIVFHFKDAGIKFRSTEIEALIVENKTASIKALGKINHSQGYRILISVLDDERGKDDDWDDHRDKDKNWDKDDDWNDRNGRGYGKDKGDDGEKGKDKHDNRDKDHGKKGDKKKDKDDKHKKKADHIRVKIWDPSGKVIYDTQAGEPDDAVATTPIKGGSIKVKEKNAGFDNDYESPVASSYGEESTSVYPNPFKDAVEVQFNYGSGEEVIIQVLDLSGKVVYNRVHAVSNDGSYSVNIFDEGKGRPGIYIMVIKQGKKVKFMRLVRN